MANFYRVGAAGTTDPSVAKWQYVNVATGLHTELLAPGNLSYQVPAGQTLYITRMIFEGSAAGMYFYLLYGDDAVQASAAPPTNQKMLTGHVTLLAAQTIYTMDCHIPVPALKYLHAYSSGGTLNCKTLSILV